MSFNKKILIRDFWQYLNNQEWERAKNCLDEKFVAEWPQSRIRYNGPDNFITMNANYPGTHDIHVLNIYECGDQIISEVEIQSEMPDGNNLHLFAISIFQIKNQKILKAIEYWADCYNAPAWQKQYYENMDLFTPKLT